MTRPKDHSHSPDSEHRFRAADAFHLGEALIIPSLNRIEVHAAAHQIEPKVMKVLLLLCARPGHVVYRDQILQPVWGQTGDDYLLNRAISELRKIFGDSAQQPNYIETIRKTGYRVVAPIRPMASAALVAAVPKPVKPVDELAEQLSATPPAASSSPVAHHLSNKRLWLFACIGIVTLCAALLILNISVAPSAPFSIDHYQVYPATHFPGREYDGALSPDGSRIVYIADEADSPAALFIKMVRGEQALKLSGDEGRISSPRWTPDGQNIFYLSLTEPVLRFFRVSPMGGEPQSFHEDTNAFGVRGMSIAHNGEQLIYAKRSAPNGPHQLWLLSLTSGEQIQLTDPPAGSLGDIDPLFAPNGESVVFVRGSNEVTKDVYRLNLASRALTRLTHDNRKINGVAWSPDATHLIFTSTRSGLYRLWTIGSEGGEPRPLSLGWESVHQPRTALGVDAIAFEDWKHTAKLVSVDLSRGIEAHPESLKMSQRWDSNPSISPDGQTLVFASNRGGPFGIWRGALNSDVANEWANLEGAYIDNPTWSPDGQQIVFDASPEGRARLYLLKSGSTSPQVLPLGDSDYRTPAWSRDSTRIYFESNPTGSWQLYAWQVGRGEIYPIRVINGRNPQESVDGEWLLYATGDGIWRCRIAKCVATEATFGDPSASAESELLIPGLAENDLYNWTPSRNGIFFVRRSPERSAHPTLAFFSYADSSIAALNPLSRDFRGWGMTLAPDESRLYFTEMTLQGADIKIARP